MSTIIDDTSDPTKGEIFKVVEHMPLFPGCGEVKDYAQHRKCAQKKLLDYIYENLEYNATAKANGTEGMAVVSFVVELDGHLSDLKIVRDPGDGLGQNALDVFKKMQKEDLRWVPGAQYGIKVRVLYNVPIKFKL